MMKRVVLAIAVAAVIVVIYMVSNNGGIDSLTNGGADDLAVECGWSASALSSSDGTVGVVITNNGEKAATNVIVLVKACDAEGNVIAYGENDPDVQGGYASGSAMERYTISCIMPGEKSGIVVFGFGLAEAADHIEASIDHVTWKDTEKVSERLVLEDASYDLWNSTITLTLQNNTDHDYGDLLYKHNLNVYVIARDSDGTIVGGSLQSLGQTYWDGQLDGQVVKAGEETVLDEYLYSERILSLGAASYEVYINTEEDNDITGYYVDDKEYSEEEYIQYLKDEGVWDE